MIRFEHSDLFYLLLLIPLIITVFMIHRIIRRRAIRKFGKESIVVQMMPLASSYRPLVKLVIFLLALSSVIMAMVNPQIGSRMDEGRIEGVDIVVALDVSRSMLAQDIRPDRLERAKLAVNRLIDRLEQDRIGIVVFAGTAHVQVPITSDHHAAKMILRTVNTRSVQVQGTAIESSIDRALLAFTNDDLHNKTIILVSDGESHDDDPVAAARRAADRGVVIHTVGVGSREGAPIPIIENDQVTGYFRDRAGNTVITRYDEQLLKAIAEATGGIFRHGTGPDLGLEDILQEIRSIEKEEFETRLFAEYESKFHYFVSLAIFLLLLDLLIMSRKNKYFSRIRLFD